MSMSYCPHRVFSRLQSRKTTSFRPLLEELEDRLTPSHTVAVAVASPPAEFVEGTAIFLNSTVTGATAPTYDWSVTKDGAALATGTPTTNADFSFTPDDNAGYAVSLTVKDGDADVVTDSSTIIAVVNGVPTASITGPTAGVPGQPLSFTVSATDPSSVDQAAGFTYQVHWDDTTTDDIVPASPGNGSGVPLNHTFTGTGAFQVSVTATDKNTGASTASTLTVTISSTAVVSGTLFVGGTVGNDNINIIPKGPPKATSATVKVLMNGASLGTFKGMNAVHVFAQAGADKVHLAGAIKIPATLEGGAGNDRLTGAKGKDLLLGGDGDDHLNGHTNNDVLVGGPGADRMLGGPGDDLLIAGSLFFANDSAAMAALWQAWSAHTSTSVRVAALTNPAAAVALTFTGPNPTVLDDGASDTVTGTAGQDWFVATVPQDVITDLHANEFLNGGKATGKGNGNGNGNGNGKGK